jgi:hypothetical protein
MQAHHFGTLVYRAYSTTGGPGQPGAACPLPSSRAYCGAAALKSLLLLATDVSGEPTGQQIGRAYIFCDAHSCYFTSIGAHNSSLGCQWHLEDHGRYSCLSYAISRAALFNGTHFFAGTFGYVARGATCRCRGCQVGCWHGRRRPAQGC